MKNFFNKLGFRHDITPSNIYEDSSAHHHSCKAHLRLHRHRPRILAQKHAISTFED